MGGMFSIGVVHSMWGTMPHGNLTMFGVGGCVWHREHIECGDVGGATFSIGGVLVMGGWVDVAGCVLCLT